MTNLLRVFRLMLRAQGRALFYGALLALIVLLMGAALLGLSGWFITAAAVAGLAGVGVDFDVFRPSSMVRFLALGRTVARYGERLTTHDATLKVLASLRIRLLQNLAARPYGQMTRLRGATALNRITADVDALDGIPLRLILPIGAGLGAHAIAFGIVWWLSDIRIAAAIAGIYVLGTAAVFAMAASRAHNASAAAERAAQGFRARLADLVRARTDLIVHGRLGAEMRKAAQADGERRSLQARLDRIARRSAAALSLIASAAGSAALYLGMRLAESGTITPAIAAMGFFTALGLAETIAPMSRAVTELGRMSLAAGRMDEVLAPPAAPSAHAPADQPAGQGDNPTQALEFNSVSFQRSGAAQPVLDGVTLALNPGETLALTGASGSGKSTLLELAAGLIDATGGQVHVLGRDMASWSEAELRAAVTLVPQRAHLVAGSLRENLAVAAPQADDATLLAALDACQLAETFAARQGLDTRLAPGGGGLSGGQARRVVLARALLRRPPILLLDEPTEGLDRPTAQAVLESLRAALPDTAMVIAAHRKVEIAAAGRVFPMT
ncbi:MAG TPA: thiol reductant ABC exporter subunit CydC [Rhodobacterales bacterium]|nr:thiol reductant ABC exporter subunit CydC [Rhodobacterales bacterium]